MGPFEIIVALTLVCWAAACACYALCVPVVSTVLNRLNRFEVFASWALATTNDIRDSSGAHSVEVCDLSCAKNAREEWTQVISSDCWTWYAFVWFPQKVLAMRVQWIGRQMGLLSSIQPAPSKTIAAHGASLERLVRQLHPPASHAVRRVRLLRHTVKNGQALVSVLWVSEGSGHGSLR